jgi:ATP-binding cassette, subfamily B, bacterial MsbA
MKFEMTLLKRLVGDNFRQQRTNYILAIICMVFVAASTGFSAYIMKSIVNEMMVSRNLDRVYIIALVILLVFLVKGFATYFQTYFMSKAGNRIIADQQRKLYNHILAQDATFFQRFSSSDFLTRITYNAQSARVVVDTIVTSFARDLLTLISLIAVMIIQQPYLAVGSLCLGPLAFVGLRLLLKKARYYMSQELASISQLIHIIQETSVGIRVIKAFHLEEKLQSRLNTAVRDIERQSNRMARVEAATAPIMETLAGFAIAGMLALSGVLVLKFGQTPGELMSFITALLLAYEPAKRLARMRVSIEGGLVGVRAMFDLLDHPIRLKETADAKVLTVPRGEIRLENVSFSYNATVTVLNNLNLTFEAGKTTAIAGPSGSGKSTMVNLIMRMYDPEAGKVSIDGQDLSQVTFQSLRASMAYVGQDLFLFTGTIRHNIGLGREGAGDEDIVAAAKAANAHDFICELEKGYDTEVGESGGNLSGGQRQRVTIARAILRNAPILILDEPTSALDSESDALIGEALEHLSAGRTTIIIAHRLSTIAKADKIIVIEAGKLVEQGSPKTLFEKNGRFQKLFASQTLQLV